MDYQDMTGPELGRLMREMVTTAAVRIKEIKDSPEDLGVETKTDYDGVADNDVVTVGDRIAQQMYVEFLNEHFPGWGAIHEEDELRVRYSLGTINARFWPDPITNAVFTDDPIDGTRRMTQRANHSISTMFGLLINGQGAAGFIADVNTGEVFGKSPNSAPKHFTPRGEIFDIVTSYLREPIPLRSEGRTLLRTEIDDYSPLIRELLMSGALGSLDQTHGDSIGTTHARLWTGEATALAIRMGTDTPWDCIPVSVIGEASGFVWLRPDAQDRFVQFRAPLPTENTRRISDALVIHRRHLDELRESVEVQLFNG